VGAREDGQTDYAALRREMGIELSAGAYPQDQRSRSTSLADWELEELEDQQNQTALYDIAEEAEHPEISKPAAERLIETHNTQTIESEDEIENVLPQVKKELEEHGHRVTEHDARVVAKNVIRESKIAQNLADRYVAALKSPDLDGATKSTVAEAMTRVVEVLPPVQQEKIKIALEPTPQDSNQKAKIILQETRKLEETPSKAVFDQIAAERALLARFANHVNPDTLAAIDRKLAKHARRYLSMGQTLQEYFATVAPPPGPVMHQQDISKLLDDTEEYAKRHHERMAALQPAPAGATYEPI